MISPWLDFTFFLRNDSVRVGTPSQTSPHVLRRLHVTVYPEWYQEATLTWNSSPDWVDAKYNVYRSITATGEMQLLTAQPISDTHFIDTETLTSSKYVEDYYVVEVILNGVVAGTSFPIACKTKLSGWHALRQQEINRREWILLKRFTGQKSLLLKNIKYGPYETRCPECWDDINKCVTKDNCTTCYGTSYKGGYYRGIPTYYQYDNFNKVKLLRNDGVYEPAELHCWGIRLPPVDVDDLIIRTTDKLIFRVDSQLDSEMLSNAVRQTMAVSMLPKTSIEYELLKREGVI